MSKYPQFETNITVNDTPHDWWHQVTHPAAEQWYKHTEQQLIISSCLFAMCGASQAGQVFCHRQTSELISCELQQPKGPDWKPA